tara:strand:- start:59 stop:640 length:582 start_codon:yes stop_codon:yes gene_type:complete
MKKLLLILLCLPLLFTTCKKEDEEPTNNTNNNNSGNSTNLSIGDTHQGGIIFYLDGNGGGLIVAQSPDQSPDWGNDWGIFGTAISGADGTAIGTGNQNTIDIEAGNTTAGTAADICANLTLGGYSDWFLPSKDELNEIYLQRNGGNIGGFEWGPYWSSSEIDSGFAWGQDFLDGLQQINNKETFANVRAIRAF